MNSYNKLKKELLIIYSQLINNSEKNNTTPTKVNCLIEEALINLITKYSKKDFNRKIYLDLFKVSTRYISKNRAKYLINSIVTKNY